MRAMSILLLFVALIAGCKKDSNPGGPGGETGGVIYPLSIGNQWIYRITNMDSTGTLTVQRRDTVRVLKDTTVANTTWYKSTDQTLLQNRSDGLWLCLPIAGGDFQALWLKYPASVGDSYSMTSGQFSIGDVSVQSTGVSVTVPAGAYSCYLYRLGGPTPPGTLGSYTEFFASPGVGIVKIESFFERANATWYSGVRTELLSMAVH